MGWIQWASIILRPTSVHRHLLQNPNALQIIQRQPKLTSYSSSNLLAETTQTHRLIVPRSLSRLSDSVMFDCASQPDHFDRIPDSVVLLILNRIGGDVKDLVRCSLVSKRFHDLVREVPNIVFKVDSVNWISKSSSAVGKPQGMFSSIFQWPTRLSKAVRSDEVDRQTLTRVLKNFTDIRCLKIEFPSRDHNDLLLKWKAEFGSKLEKCVILYADPVVYPRISADGVWVRDGRIVECHIGSCVMAGAYDKHYLLHPIVVEHSKLESLVLTDANGKGTMSMNRSQLEEFRLKPSPASSAFEGTLNMQVSYADNLELPDGIMLKGAKLIVTLPSEQSLRVKQDSWVDDAFEEPYGTAVRMLKERRIIHRIEATFSKKKSVYRITPEFYRI